MAAPYTFDEVALARLGDGFRSSHSPVTFYDRSGAVLDRVGSGP